LNVVTLAQRFTRLLTVRLYLRSDLCKAVIADLACFES